MYTCTDKTLTVVNTSLINLGQGGTPRLDIINKSHINPKIREERQIPLIKLKLRVELNSELIPHNTNNPDEINP